MVRNRGNMDEQWQAITGGQVAVKNESKTRNESILLHSECGRCHQFYTAQSIRRHRYRHSVRHAIIQVGNAVESFPQFSPPFYQQRKISETLGLSNYSIRSLLAIVPIFPHLYNLYQ